MLFATIVNNPSNALTSAELANDTIFFIGRIALIIFLLGMSLWAGLFLRRTLIKRLPTTVLDNWVIQTLGVVIALPPIIAVLVITPIIYRWSVGALPELWIQATGGAPPDIIYSIAWNIIQTILLITLGIGLARTAKNIAIRSLGENRLDINIRTLIGRIFYVAILIFVGFWILSIWQVSIGIPVAALGIITVAITVSIQEVLKDLAAGFYILIERPFYIGDQITIAPHTGKVQDVQLRATKLRLLSGEEVTIPNSRVFTGIVVNNSFYRERRATLAVTLPAEEYHKNETHNSIINMLRYTDGVMEKPEPVIVFSSYASKKVTLTVQFYVAPEQLSIISDVMYALHMILPGSELAIREPVGAQ